MKQVTPKLYKEIYKINQGLQVDSQVSFQVINHIRIQLIYITRSDVGGTVRKHIR